MSGSVQTDYRSCYERAIRLTRLFSRITRRPLGSPEYNAVFECVWYRTARSLGLDVK